MPAYVRAALGARGLMEAYRARPSYQQNDYVGWIARGVREATRQKRLEQMLDELERGGVYMKMHDPERVVPARPKKTPVRRATKTKAPKRKKK